MKFCFSVTSLALALGLSISASATTYTYTDSTFDLGNYSGPTLVYGAVTVTPSQCPSCGNPGSALQLFVTIPNTGAEYSRAFVNNTFAYNPQTQGTIQSIATSVDKDVTLNFPIIAFANTFRPAIEQDGIIYLAAVPGTSVTTGRNGGTTGFVTFAASGLTAADFFNYNYATRAFGTANPNFSGDSLLFGLAQNLTLGGPLGTDTIVYDNLNFTITSGPAPAPTPEPSSLVLLASGLPITAAAVRLRKRRL